MEFCCGSSLITNTYAKFEAGKFRRTPSAENIAESIRWASSNGFEAIEIPILTGSQLISTFDRHGIELIDATAASFHVLIPHLSFPFISGTFPSESEQQKLRELFSTCLEITSALGARMVQVHSPPIPGTEASWDVAYPGGPARKISFHWSDEDWEKVWKQYVEWIHLLCSLCEHNGLKLAVEARPREIVSNTDAMLRLLDDVNAPNLGVVFDTGHHFIMREILPVSIWKLGPAIYSVQLSDNDGIVEYQWAPGEGKIEWRPVIQALKSVSYGGYLVIEASGLQRRFDDFAKARYMIQSLLERDFTSTLEGRKRLASSQFSRMI